MVESQWTAPEWKKKNDDYLSGNDVCVVGGDVWVWMWGDWSAWCKVIVEAVMYTFASLHNTCAYHYTIQYIHHNPTPTHL